MPTDAASGRLATIVTAVATKLMGATVGTSVDISTEVLADLVAILGVDVSFLRYNDHTIHATVLVAEWPQRPNKPEPDPLHTVYFAEADPVFAAAEHAKEPVVIRPASSNEEYQRTISEARGIPAVSLASVPLLSNGVTTGTLGFIKFGDREWSEDELNTLTVVASMFAQVQTRLSAEDRLRHQAEHDHLTSLPNRRKLLEHLDFRLGEGQPGPVAALLFNLDRLKPINDYLGHAAGDQFIRDFATRIIEAMQDRGLIARLGGDDFVVVPVSAMDVDAATELAEAVSKQVTDHVDIGGVVLNRTVSVGVATGTPGKESSLDLLRYAEEALLSVKRTGGERIGAFSAEMLTRRELRNDIELHLQAGIESSELTVFYLPEVDMPTGKILAVEALVRWQHPTRGLLSPEEFVSVAESINVAGELGNWMLRAACAHLAEWRSHGVGRDVMLRVNVSPAQLVAHNLVETVERTMEEFGLDGSSLGLEITESVVIRDLENTRATLRGLRQLGVDIAVDDFGTGYSGMGLLRTLPVGTVKIDRGFVVDLAGSGEDLAIVRAVVGLARALDLVVVAEGVETVGAAQVLLREGCSRAQGYMFSRPVTAEETERLLAEGSVPVRIEPTASATSG